MREALKSHGGSEVKTIGDGFMASISSATKALECAIAMQRAFAEHNEGAEEPILVRVGLLPGALRAGPLEEAVRWHHTAPFLERVPEGEPLLQRLGAGVYLPIADFRVLRPVVD